MATLVKRVIFSLIAGVLIGFLVVAAVNSTRPRPAPPVPDQKAKTASEMAFLRQYEADNGIPDSDWYGHVKELYRTYGTIVLNIKTDIYPDSDAKSIAEQICGAYAGVTLWPESNAKYVKVLDQNGWMLTKCGVGA